MSKKYYEILGVEKTATEDEIKKAFRALSKKYHPDKNPDDESAKAKFQEIVEAYEVLSNPEKRKKFDNPQSEFDDLRSQFQSHYSAFRQQSVPRGGNIEVWVSLTLSEMKTGAVKNITYTKHVLCKSCDGNGSKHGKSLTNCSLCGGSGQVIRQMGPMRIQMPCEHCGGHGKFVTEECDQCHAAGMTQQDMNLDLNVPAGAFEGWRTKINSGLGHDSPFSNGSPGELIIAIREIPHPLFKRQGDDLFYNLKLSYPDIILGVKVEIPTLDNNVAFDVPENTPIGKVFRLKGRGIPSIQGGPMGDMMVVASLDIPETISEDDKKILAELRKSINFTSKDIKKNT